MNQNGGIHKGGFAVLCHRNGGSESPGILNQAMSVKNGNAGYQMIAHGLGYGIFLGTDFWNHNKNLYAKKLYYKNKKPVIRNDWFGYRRDSLGLKQVASFVDFTIQYAQCKDLKQLNAGR